MVYLSIRDDRLYLQIGLQEYLLESATIYCYPLRDKRFEIVVFYADMPRKSKTFKQKYLNLTQIPLESKYLDDFRKREGMTEVKYASTKNWYMNYYKY